MSFTLSAFEIPLDDRRNPICFFMDHNAIDGTFKAEFDIKKEKLAKIQSGIEGLNSIWGMLCRFFAVCLSGKLPSKENLKKKRLADIRNILKKNVANDYVSYSTQANNYNYKDVDRIPNLDSKTNKIEVVNYSK